MELFHIIHVCHSFGLANSAQPIKYWCFSGEVQDKFTSSVICLVVFELGLGNIFNIFDMVNGVGF